MVTESVPAARATRESGKQTRMALFNAATELFLEHGDSVSIAQICTAAGAHPNQVDLLLRLQRKALRRGGVRGRSARRQACRGRCRRRRPRSAITPRSWSDPSWARALPASNSSWKR